MKLPSKAVQHLRGLGHTLNAVLQIGKDGLSAAVIAQAKGALVSHELIKVRLASESPLDRHETAEALAVATNASLVQVIGRTFLLYRESPKKKEGKINLETGKRAPKKTAAENAKRSGGKRLGVKSRAKAKAASQPRHEEKKPWGARGLPKTPSTRGAEARPPAREPRKDREQAVKKSWKDR